MPAAVPTLRLDESDPSGALRLSRADSTVHDYPHCNGTSGDAPLPEQDDDPGPGLTTEQLATLLGLKPQTLRKRYSQMGAYFGLRPRKFKNGRLRWPTNSVSLLMHAANSRA